MDITKKAALVVGSTALVLGSAGAASAQDNYANPTPAPKPAVQEPEVKATPIAAPAAPAATPTAAPAAAPTVAAAQQLPVTGGEATGLAAIGAALIAGGGVLVWRSKGTAEA